jgi:MerR family transcriptional regulator, light-induced transcriptional regulator
MNQFSIRDIENLCNIKAHTLRIWEQRYGFFVPKRKESKHRVYTGEDLKELLRISFLYHNGHKISRIACLSCEEIRQAVATAKLEDDNHELFINQLIAASIEFDRERFEKTVNNLVMRLGLEKCIPAVFCPFLERIGLLWLTNNVIPAHEHFSSHIIAKKIICAIDGLGTPVAGAGDPHILVFAPPGEFHEIPLLAANYYFRKHQNPTSYFGTNVSLKTIEYYSRHHPVTHFYAHVITNLCHSGLGDFINALCDMFPDRKVVISGPACMCLEENARNLRIIHSLPELIHFAKNLKG